MSTSYVPGGRTKQSLRTETRTMVGKQGTGKEGRLRNGRRE